MLLNIQLNTYFTAWSFYWVYLLCVIVHHCVCCPLTLWRIKGLGTKTKRKLWTQAIIFWTIEFLKESFVEASLAMASLCGLKAWHIWSNYLTRKQLSVILKGEGFQLINLLRPLVLLPFPPNSFLVSHVVKESFVRRERHYMSLLRLHGSPALGPTCNCLQGIWRT